MNATLVPLKPADVARMLADGRAVVVDVREPDEFRGGHVEGAVSLPLSRLGSDRLDHGGKTTVFTCRTGRRTSAACDRLAAAVDGEAYVLDGGLDSWAAAGLPVARS
jgi:rhodanese-related sulfurtransferase